MADESKNHRDCSQTMTSDSHTASSSRRKSASSTPNRPGVPATPSAQTLHQYQAALQLMQTAKYEKAIVAFDKLIATATPEIAERCKMYLSACHRQKDRGKLSFDSLEERYDYAISLLNRDYFEEAREQFHEILAEQPEADYAHYGLAVLAAVTGQTEECLESLSQAIARNERNRLQARTDSDFQAMLEDPRFTELLYPEIS